ncbi:hypothetical protein I8J29_20630 [Paenibacillus sp. MWE-103]|uniref:Helix-turn-helix domain-containing protein n=1 Tax=Paenibacillus artemisiicola TaxID=1172618 RepID=A0ABS3WE94_9BACL|nr:hypothetical protein [Paenibacillus artemisiicola]MBO7746627.1 hypothetical protein [Paenibacillus artemisiicola]
MEPWQTIMLLGGIAIVCAAVLPRRKAADGSARGGAEDRDRTMRGMETALEQFMENMEADNREIADLVGKSAQEAQAMAAKRDERLERLETRCAELEAALSELLRTQRESKTMPALYNVGTPPEVSSIAADEPSIPAEAGLREAAFLAADSPEDDTRTDSIRGRYSELFELHSAGKSIEAIAKKLGRHKGEVQLILQLAKQEEAAR